MFSFSTIHNFLKFLVSVINVGNYAHFYPNGWVYGKTTGGVFNHFNLNYGLKNEVVVESSIAPLFFLRKIVPINIDNRSMIIQHLIESGVSPKLSDQLVHDKNEPPKDEDLIDIGSIPNPIPIDRIISRYDERFKIIDSADSILQHWKNKKKFGNKLAFWLPFIGANFQFRGNKFKLSHIHEHNYRKGAWYLDLYTIPPNKYIKAVNWHIELNNTLEIDELILIENSLDERIKTFPYAEYEMSIRDIESFLQSNDPNNPLSNETNHPIGPQYIIDMSGP